MKDFDYTVKVYSDAVELGFRTVESIPAEYQQAVINELSKREWQSR